MQIVEQLGPLREQVRQWRLGGERLALVPTMGNLHAGHLALVAEAGARAERVLASIFVNPMQFGPDEDFASYPRTLEPDQAALAAAGTDLLFIPGMDSIYPRGQELHTRVEVPGLSSILCGAARPGHFAGVATVVCKLVNMVQPDLAVFGEKDFQQLAVIRRMVADLCLPVEILGVPTVREPDGLAMSSRNGYLSALERARAPLLYRTLNWVAEQVRGGDPDFRRIEGDAVHRLQEAGFEPEYISIRRTSDLAEPAPSDAALVVLAAARLGRARLIDNLRI